MAFLEPMIVKQKAVRDDKVAPLVPKEVFRVYPITAFFSPNKSQQRFNFCREESFLHPPMT